MTTKKSTIQTPEQIISQNMEIVSRKIASYTCAICFLEKNKPVPVSSGIFLKAGDERFLVTAAHTIKQHRSKGLGVLMNRRFQSISGHYGISSPEETDSDKIDIAFYKLDDEFVKQVSTKFKFYDLSQMGLDHDDTSDNWAYFIVGYPISRIEVNDYKHKISMRPLLFMTDLIEEPKYFDSIGVESKSHLLISYDQNKNMHLPTENVGTGPDPTGLSGGGVWRISNPIVHDPDLIKYFPTGMVVEFYKEHKVLVLTRLRVITEAIRNSFQSDIRKSRRISIK